MGLIRTNYEEWEEHDDRFLGKQLGRILCIGTYIYIIKPPKYMIKVYLYH